MTILVTGGCGFIGTNLIRDFVKLDGEKIINLDKLTYAGNKENLSDLNPDLYELVVGDIGDAKLVSKIFKDFKPKAIVHLAAESHVDRSILGPLEFIQTNVFGTFTLLEEAKSYYESLAQNEKEDFRMLCVSTDEVFGSLEAYDAAFTEKTAYAPNSPYSASKAGADHLARAYFKTYGLPVIISNCSNNYGPYQFPEKLIPLVTLNALSLKTLPIYGDGLQIRDWLHVSDHSRALRLILKKGKVGESYNIGGNSEKTNIEVVRLCCELLDKKRPRGENDTYLSLISHVKDRPGHDKRYAIDSSKIEETLGFKPNVTFEEGISQTIDWYLSNSEWVERVQSGEYKNWMSTQYGENND
ncbi:MAG: dTDP-glucose 4,6-dehydratase [Deltaproteobacteria bacterium]|jgi:dTDP-glucose 4,6-dehydratase|nr:dTDP-glucose 4,6-dehydratase [Deltaproteobacteria bacterium]